MNILCYGSLNIDCVYKVPHIVRPGETIASCEYSEFPGGKGANQAVAAARAGAAVFHAGKIGRDGIALRDVLAAEGIDVANVAVDQKIHTGRAIIQVETGGAENAIVLFPGTNQAIGKADIDTVLAKFGNDTMLILQNEISHVPYLIEKAKKSGLKICFNPAPFNPEIKGYPLKMLDIIILNEIEAEGLSGESDPQKIILKLSKILPETEIVLTLGAKGALYYYLGESLSVPAEKVKAVDTTAAGDTFIGYLIAGRTAGLSAGQSLKNACRAAAITVTRPGAIPSIPFAAELG
ncbi:MAG: ribokinase [Victivallaceae bacterium]